MSGRILVAGIGNIFLGDDGFGVEVVRRLAEHNLPESVIVADFGIRGMDLAYSLLEDYEAVLLVDAAQRGEQPGTLSLIEHEEDLAGITSLDTHGMDPVKVLRLARSLGAFPTRILVVTCEPAVLGSVDDMDVTVGLSAPVEAAVDEGIRMVKSLLGDLLTEGGDIQAGAERDTGTDEAPANVNRQSVVLQQRVETFD